MPLKKKPVTGMKDILPAEMQVRDYVTGLIGTYREPVQQTGRRQREADLQDHEERRETESGDCPE